MERDFQPLLIASLKECAERRRWGLFEQNEHPEAQKYLEWKEATELRHLALEIRRIRASWGDVNPIVEKFLACCAERGPNVEGEPKRAAKFLLELSSKS